MPYQCSELPHLLATCESRKACEQHYYKHYSGRDIRPHGLTEQLENGESKSTRLASSSPKPSYVADKPCWSRCNLVEVLSAVHARNGDYE